MLGSLDKAAEPETKKEVKSEEPSTQTPVTPPVENPPAQEPVTPPNNPEPEPEPQQPEEQKPVTPPEEEKITYTIKHFKQNLEDDDYTLIEDATETKKLTKLKSDADTYGKGLEKTFEGFRANLYLGSDNVVSIKYERIAVQFTFDADGGKWSDGKSTLVVEGKYGRPVTAPENPTKITDEIDYKFTGWDNQLPSTFGLEAKTFKATWEVEKTLCRIEHYKQNLENDEYTKVDADTQEVKLPPMYVSTDVPMDYVKDYEGFEFNHTVLNAQHYIEYYYDRESITILFDSNGGSWSGNQTQKTVSCKFGETISVPEQPTREGYVLAGWGKHSSTEIIQLQPDDTTYTISSSQFTTLYAQWKPKPLRSLAVALISNGDVLINVYDGNRFVAEPLFPKSDGATYEWYFNNVKQDSTTRECIIDTTNLQPGYYELFVKAINEYGIYYISCCQVTVQ